MKERGNWLNLPGKHNCILWNLGPRKSLSLSPHIDIPLGGRRLLRVEGTYNFFIHRRLTPEESYKQLADIRVIFKNRVECDNEEER